MNIEWICDLKAPSGYGRASRADLRSVIKQGYSPSVVMHQHDRTELKLEQDKFWSEHVDSVLTPPKGDADIVIWQETPEFYLPDPTTFNIARIEWETSKILDYDHDNNPRFNWVKQLNSMSLILPASEFVAQTLRDSGVTTPCHVIPHPTDLETLCPGDKHPIGGTGSRSINMDKFTVLSTFQYTPRKNPRALLCAWARSSLGKRQDCSLVLKTYGSGFEDNTNIIKEVASFRKSLNIPGLVRNVYPWTKLIPENRMRELYNTADVFVTTTRGEGFGMPMAEAMACGLPVIYADNTAHAEFCIGYPVPCHATPVIGMPHIPWYSAAQDWWDIDILKLVDTLEVAYEDWKSGKLQELGSLARQKVKEIHSDESVGRLFAEQFNAIATEED